MYMLLVGRKQKENSILESIKRDLYVCVCVCLSHTLIPEENKVLDLKMARITTAAETTYDQNNC